MGREIVNSRQSTVMDSLPLAARRTNCIRWSSTSTSFQDIVSSLPARNSNPRCKGCLGNDCKGCHGTAHFRWPTPTFECGGGASAFTHPATPPERAVSALTQADVLPIPHCLLASDPQKNKKATHRVASSQKTLQSKTISSSPTRP